MKIVDVKRSCSIAWTEELSRYCMIWMTMIGTGISVRKGMQMSINIWGSRLKGKALLIADLVSYLFCFGFCGVIMVSVIKLFMVQLVSGQRSPAMHIPMYIMTCAIFIGMLFLCLVEVEQIVNLFAKEKKDKLPKEGDKE